MQIFKLDSVDNNMERKELNGVVGDGVRWGKIVDQSANSNIIDLLVLSDCQTEYLEYICFVISYLSVQTRKW